MRAKTIKISQNIYGNYRGFVTGQGWNLIGSNDFDAVAWVADKMVANPEATYAGDTWITLDKVRGYIAKIYS